MEIFHNTNFDFLGKKGLFIGLSLVLTVAGLGSLIMKGGPSWGLDFKGGAMIDVRFDKTPPVDALRQALAKNIKGEVSVQEVVAGGVNDVQIGVEAQNAQELEAARAKIFETLTTSYGNTGGKLDLNNSGAEALANRLREPLARGGVSLNDDQLKAAVTTILTHRDKDKSGLISSLDSLASLPGVGQKFVDVMKQECGMAPYNIRNVQVVSPKVTGDLRNDAIKATLYALAAMLVYIAFRFEWIYGLAAVIAVFHDTIMTVGLFSIFNKPIDLTVVAALLTLVGYSMNDTIVVFDRIRENLKTTKGMSFEALVNLSINQTLSRTILTSGLTFLTCLALWLFGGPVLNGFAFALVVGVLVGTYSSIFIAAPIVIFWRNFMQNRNGGAAAPVAVAAKRTAK
jgi:preprotein translocase subunit SecF